MSERLFVALALPPAVRTALAGLVSPIADANWTPPENLHLTLRFLGDVPAEVYDSMLQHLAQIRVAPFILPMEGVGSFPPHAPPRVLWAGVGKGHPRLFQLRQRLDDALLAAGVPLDVRNFHPHATLARCGDHAGHAVAQWLRAHRSFEAPPFSVESFGVYTSTLSPGGAVYRLKDSFPLVGA